MGNETLAPLLIPGIAALSTLLIGLLSLRQRARAETHAEFATEANLRLNIQHDIMEQLQRQLDGTVKLCEACEARCQALSAALEETRLALWNARNHIAVLEQQLRSVLPQRQTREPDV
jgi:hypothetical protein